MPQCHYEIKTSGILGAMPHVTGKIVTKKKKTTHRSLDGFLNSSGASTKVHQKVLKLPSLQNGFGMAIIKNTENYK